MRQSWTDFLNRSSAGHGVQLYRDDDELAETVAGYVTAGLEAGEPVLLVATEEHLGQIGERLTASGRDLAQAVGTGEAVVADAAATLASLMEGDRPSPERFERLVGELLGRCAAAAGGRTTRVFGEMVDLLTQDGRYEAALALERLWESALGQHDFRLLCAYRLDVFDAEAQRETIPHVCAAHTHVLPAQHYARFARAVDRALEESLGHSQAAAVYRRASLAPGHDGVPLAERILVWLSANMPDAADRILASARDHYLGAPASA